MLGCFKQKKLNVEDLPLVLSAEAVEEVMKHGGVPSFDQVLSGEIPVEPWVPATFLEFLHDEKNDENFFFFEEVEALKAVIGKPVKRPSEELLLLPGAVRTDPKTYVNEIVNTFVKEDAPRQVNISDDQRTRLLSSVTSSLESHGYEPEIFNEAQTEVKRLMMLDSWPRFKKKMLTENISKEDSTYRLKEAMAFFLVSVFALALMLGFQAPRWYIFILAIPLYFAYEEFLTYKLSFCMRNAMKGLRDRFGKVSDRAPLACPIVRKFHKNRIRKMFIVITLLTVITTGFFFSLTYIIEAALGKSIYG